MAGAPSFEQRLRDQESLCLEKQRLWGWSTSVPTVPTRRLPWRPRQALQRHMMGEWDKSCTSKQGKVIFPKDSQSISRLPRDTTISPSLEVFKISWTKPWVICDLLWAGGWARWAQKVLFLPELFWHSCTVNCYLSWKKQYQSPLNISWHIGKLSYDDLWALSPRAWYALS